MEHAAGVLYYQLTVSCLLSKIAKRISILVTFPPLCVNQWLMSRWVVCNTGNRQSSDWPPPTTLPMSLDYGIEMHHQPTSNHGLQVHFHTCLITGSMLIFYHAQCLPPCVIPIILNYFHHIHGYADQITLEYIFSFTSSWPSCASLKITHWPSSGSCKIQLRHSLPSVQMTISKLIDISIHRAQYKNNNWIHAFVWFDIEHSLYYAGPPGASEKHMLPIQVCSTTIPHKSNAVVYDTTYIYDFCQYSCILTYLSPALPCPPKGHCISPVNSIIRPSRHSSPTNSCILPGVLRIQQTFCSRSSLWQQAPSSQIFQPITLQTLL